MNIIFRSYKSISYIFVAILLINTSVFGQKIPQSPAPEDARVYFISPSDQASLVSPILIRFGLSNMGIAPAGSNIKNNGHHHLIIDLEELPPLDQSLPASANVRHFGLGQTEAYIDLPPGEHTLQLVLGDWLHVPHEQPVLSEKITIYVER